MTTITHNFIGGERIAPTGTGIFEVRSPYNGELVGTVPAATSGDIDLAVAAARRAFDDGPWPRMSPAERQAVLRKFAGLHAARCGEFAELISRENGEPLLCTSAVQYYIAPQNEAFLKAASEFPWETVRPGFPQGRTLWRNVPLGVVAAVIPWNAPHQSALSKLMPALLAGCTVVLKLAPETGIDGHLLGELFTEAGVPKGVLSILTADRAVSAYLVGHPGVDKIAFTGSTDAGKKVASTAGASLKRVSLELGGKSVALILPDADLAATAEALRFASFLNNGQACVAQTRILVPSNLHDRFVEALVTVVKSMKIGNPIQHETFIGPLVSKRQQARVWEYIASGISEGATLAIGGLGMPDGIEEGAFVRPTVFANVKNCMRIAQEEIFGPVVCVIPYDGIDQAIELANDSQFGLAGGVWTADETYGAEVARGIRTGTVAINGHGPDFLAPFGGFKQSGIGREFGEQGLSHYVEHQSVFL
jgi:acyl-CoA reductase-like NAD-dependent aldehyde dehydrogenase